MDWNVYLSGEIHSDWRERIMEGAKAAGLDVAPSRDGRDLYADRHLRERGAFVTVDHPEVGEIQLVGPPFRLSGMELATVRAPLLGEHTDEILLDVHRAILEKYPDALLVLTPRHPERFDDVASLVESRGFGYCRRSSSPVCQPESQVYLGDTMGELTVFFAAADVAFVAGSLMDDPEFLKNVEDLGAVVVPVQGESQAAGGMGLGERIVHRDRLQRRFLGSPEPVEGPEAFGTVGALNRLGFGGRLRQQLSRLVSGS